MADGARPSFTAFWKKLKSKRSTVVQQKAVSDEAGDQNKAQIRRQQVRRAQLEHRQRKAGYVRQLELDVAQLRDSIAHVEQESGVLRRENDVIRGVLQRAGVELDPESQRPRGDAAAAAGELFGGIDVDKVMVTLSMDAVMGRPCFHIEAPPKQQPSLHGLVDALPQLHLDASPQPQPQQQPASHTKSSHADSRHTNSRHTNSRSGLTPAQEQRAINFILALEHVCWDHFGPDHFGPSSQEAAPDKSERGHMLTASALCMASAPRAVYSQRQAISKPQHGNASSTALSWPAVPGTISMSSIHQLAQSLNAADVEVAPVQAWFELQERYGLQVLLAGSVLQQLQQEFRDVVHCVSFGAVVERTVFESIVCRVLGRPQGTE